MHWKEKVPIGSLNSFEFVSILLAWEAFREKDMRLDIRMCWNLGKKSLYSLPLFYSLSLMW